MKPEPANLQRADVQRIGNAQSHIIPDAAPGRSASFAQTGLKALAGEVLGRTLPRTIDAHSAQTPRTLGAQQAGDPRKSEQAELATLVRQSGEAYGFTEQEHIEALSAALADPEEALTCFRTMMRELHRGKEKV